MTKEQFNYIGMLQAYAAWPNIGQDVQDFIACQFALESNFGKSLLARKFHNHCGMKRSLKRISYRNDDTGVFAHYDSVSDCLADYVCWLVYNHFTYYEMHSFTAFSEHLRNSPYCPEKDYVDRINLIYQQFKSYKND